MFQELPGRIGSPAGRRDIGRVAVHARRISSFAMAAFLVATLTQSAGAAVLCVNPGGSNGCFAKIQDAVSAAAVNDTVSVAPGTYNEAVVIGQPLSLIGASRENTVINASGLSAAVFIDGIDNAGLANVVVKGFTLANANFAGILVANASFVTIAGNNVENNNKSLVISNATCPGIPDYETAEGFDCGEGIHLTGVDHSTVANNFVHDNAGGILLSDDTGATHDNLISGNRVHDNPYDCGITLASHPAAAFTEAAGPFGVYHNTISENDSSENGTKLPGAGAGVGIFDSVPGTANYGNVVINNRLTNNGLPGVAMHGHAPGQNMNDNQIVGNVISGNGADTDDAATSGPTGINVFSVTPATGIVISQNVIRKESIDVAVHTGAQVTVTLNNLFDAIGVETIDTGIIGSPSVNALENWWKCPGGPGAPGCGSAVGPDILTAPWLTSPSGSRDDD